MGNKLLLFAQLRSSWESLHCWVLLFRFRVVLEYADEATAHEKSLNIVIASSNVNNNFFHRKDEQMKLQKQLRQQSRSTLLLRLCKHQNCPSTSFPQPIRFDASGSPSVQSRVMRPSNLFWVHLKMSQKLRFSDKALYYPQNCIIVKRRAIWLYQQPYVATYARQCSQKRFLILIRRSRKSFFFFVSWAMFALRASRKKEKIRFASSQTPRKSRCGNRACVWKFQSRMGRILGEVPLDAEPRELVHIHRLWPQFALKCERRSIKS